jgi:hypothetical protein
MTHAQGTLAYMSLLFFCFRRSLVLPSLHSYLFSLLDSFFYFHSDDLQLVDVFLPSMLSISIASRICTDIAF